MAQAPSASKFTLNSRQLAAQAILLGYDDADLATVLSSARTNGFPQAGSSGFGVLVNADIATYTIGNNNL